MIVLISPALARGETMLAVQPEVLSFTEASTMAAVTAIKGEKRDFFEKMEAKLRSAALKALFRLNLQLINNGKALSLGQDRALKVSKKRVQIIWTRPSKRELALEITKGGEATLGYSFSF